MPTLSNAMRLSTAGLAAERFSMDVIATNLANANSTKSGGVDPYRRHIVVLRGDEDGPKIVRVEKDMTEFRVNYDPGNPNADAIGNVTMTNVQPIKEMVDMVSASRAYEANIAAFNAAKGMIKAALTIGRI